MSEIRIALVAEGPLDRLVIEAALKVIVPRPFVLVLLQPEATRPEMGSGWGGVLKWCRAAGLRHQGSLDSDPTLADFDLLILHIDADVADKSYEDCGQHIAQMAVDFGWRALPCALPCPPAENTCAELRSAIDSWLGDAAIGQKTVLCTPSKSVGTWLAAAVLPMQHPLLNGAECNASLEDKLSRLPLKHRISKSVRGYRMHEDALVQNWTCVTTLCGQASDFQRTIGPLIEVVESPE